MTIQGADPLKMFFAPFVAEDIPKRVLWSHFEVGLSQMVS